MKKRVSVSTDNLKKVMKLADRCIKYMIRSDLLNNGNCHCDTEEFLKAFNSVKKEMSESNAD